MTTTPPTADDVRALVRSAPRRWESLRLRHRSPLGEIDATLRHGELDGRTGDGRSVHERGPTPTSWTVREIEPIWQSYLWAAMLDPYELGDHVAITDVREDRVAGRPVWRFRARAEEGYDPICSCCPLVLCEITERYERGDDWVPPPGTTLPAACDLAIDVDTGIVVSSRDVGGSRWFETEILAAT